jgi:class 3 adenylate cyclase
METIAPKKVLVIEDEPSIRNNIMLMLKVERYAAVGAENGRIGLELARKDPPDLILCDVMMPDMDGFAVLEALRAEPRFAEIPFIFLTALDDRSSMRRGMNLGADDYLPKPFTRNELLEAVNSRLKKLETLTQAVAARLVPAQDRLTQKFREKILGGDGTTALEDDDPASLTGRIADATVLFSDIRNFTTYSERLTSDEIAELLNAYLEAACAPVIGHRGVVMKFIGDGVMALFGIERGAHTGCREALAAVRLISARLDELNASLGGELDRPLRIGIGIHCGPAIVGEMGYGNATSITAIGDAVNTASRLESLTKNFACELVVSDETVSRAGLDLSGSPLHEIEIRGKREMLAVRIVERAAELPAAGAVPIRRIELVDA